MSELSPQLQAAARIFNDHLLQTLDRFPPQQQTLKQALSHALMGAGKRVRPLLTYASALALGDRSRVWLTPATAVELIHCYSLVHDDLPAMDNDQWRRGQPTTHIAFGEATAILAGDALQAMAFQVLSGETEQDITDQQRVAWVQMLAHAAGQQGMVDGQAIDTHASSKQPLADLAALEQMHRKKTGALIHAAVEMGGLCGGQQAYQLHRQALSDYAAALGLAFQVVDDVLDVTSDTATLGKDAGSDEAGNKITYVSSLGLSKAQDKAKSLHEQALTAISELPGDTRELRSIADFVVSRVR